MAAGLGRARPPGERFRESFASPGRSSRSSVAAFHHDAVGMVDDGGGLAAAGVLACATNAEARDQDEEGESEEFHRVGGNGETNLRDSCGDWPAFVAAQNATAECQLCDIRVTFRVF